MTNTANYIADYSSATVGAARLVGLEKTCRLITRNFAAIRGRMTNQISSLCVLNAIRAFTT